MKDKAYKVLARAKNISNSKAKDLIDRGFVFIGDRKIKLARGLVEDYTKFRIVGTISPKTIYEDDRVLVFDKPFGVLSEELEKSSGYRLLHRLDKETSGVLVLVKDEEFRERLIEEFKANRVYKEYVAIVDGIISEDIKIDSPITTEKGTRARSVIDKQNGKSAITEIYPLEVIGKKSKVKVVIQTGRTHQIRVHLKSINHIIIGDEVYGSQRKANRMLLHSKILRILDYEFIAREPKEFKLA